VDKCKIQVNSGGGTSVTGVLLGVDLGLQPAHSPIRALCAREPRGSQSSARLPLSEQSVTSAVGRSYLKQINASQIFMLFILQ